MQPHFIFNFSDLPLKAITYLGIVVMGSALFYLAYVVISRFTNPDVPSGFPTLISAIVLFSGVQLFSLGIVGEYLYRIFLQVKGRPPLSLVKRFGMVG